MSTAVKKQSAPANAFIFTAEACKFAAPTSRDNGLRRMDVEVIARTVNPVFHWYFDWIVHDFAGMTHKPKIAFDYRHDPDQPIGFADKITVGDDLRLNGVLLSRRTDDAAAEIMDLGPAGVPYEASIHFDPRSLVLELLPAGSQATVNNRVVTGPMTIARQWELLRVAFCLTGVDGGTSAMFEDTGEQFPVEWSTGTQSDVAKWDSLFRPGQSRPRESSSKHTAPASRFHGNAHPATTWESMFKRAKK